MCHGSEWSDVEFEHLAHAWLYATADSITVIDQTASMFKDKMFTKFTSFPTPDVQDTMYRCCTAKAVLDKLDETLVDMQKFWEALLMIRAWNAQVSKRTRYVVLISQLTSANTTSCAMMHATSPYELN